jgi:MoxR-like ATPase
MLTAAIPPLSQRIPETGERVASNPDERPARGIWVTSTLMTNANVPPAADILRPHAEQQFAHELAALAAADDRARPPGWNLSPWAVVTYLLGGTLTDGTIISPKYVGQQRLIEIAVATLATDRALLLLGVPGTAKTWVSEHLAAAISGDSTLLVQGTAGTTEETLRYGWNYARLLAEGPSKEALVPGPVYRGMERGAIVRVEELTRMPPEVQDALVTVLSEKVLPIPELDSEIAAVSGFNLIATANDRDRGVNDMSSALRRRFNTVVLPLPATAEEEILIVSRRVAELGVALALPEVPAAADEIRRVVTVFRELRSGVTDDQRTSLKMPTGTLSTAEAISVVTNGLALAAHFGDGSLQAGDVAGGIVGAVVSDPVHDQVVWREYLEGVVAERPDWADFYEACRQLDT